MKREQSLSSLHNHLPTQVNKAAAGLASSSTNIASDLQRELAQASVYIIITYLNVGYCLA